MKCSVVDHDSSDMGCHDVDCGIGDMDNMWINRGSGGITFRQEFPFTSLFLYLWTVSLVISPATTKQALSFINRGGNGEEALSRLSFHDIA
jgi:hypothetical protein